MSRATGPTLEFVSLLHIDLPTRSDLERIVGYKGNPAVSIYLRTTPLTQETRTDRIELKNLLKSAVDEMAAADVPKRAIWPIEASVGALVDDDEFWVHQANSLAVFVTPERISTFRLPNHLTSMVEVSDRFHVKPLIRSVTFPHHAHVLAIGMGAVRLVEVTADLPPVEPKVPGLPRDAADALGRRSHTARDTDMRSGESTSEDALMTRYARVVDRALRPVLTDEQPLILAGVEPMVSAFRNVTSYPHVAAEVIAGSADHTPDHELAQAARGVLDGIYARQIEALTQLYAQRETQDRATTDIARAARAATFGAIDTLLVDIDAVVPGTIDEESGVVTFAERADGINYGVVDEIVRRAYQSRATVVAARSADLPGGGELAAILRYPV